MRLSRPNVRHHGKTDGYWPAGGGTSGTRTRSESGLSFTLFTRNTVRLPLWRQGEPKTIQ